MRTLLFSSLETENMVEPLFRAAVTIISLLFTVIVNIVNNL